MQYSVNFYNLHIPICIFLLDTKLAFKVSVLQSLAVTIFVTLLRMCRIFPQGRTAESPINLLLLIRQITPNDLKMGSVLLSDSSTDQKSDTSGSSWTKVEVWASLCPGAGTGESTCKILGWRPFSCNFQVCYSIVRFLLEALLSPCNWIRVLGNELSSPEWSRTVSQFKSRL